MRAGSAPRWYRRRPGEATERLVLLDGLRLLGVLMLAGYLLAAYHPGAREAWGVAPQVALRRLSDLAAYGWLGAGLLLMISGFVVCAASWDRTATAFLRGRVARLLPALLVTVPLTVAVLTLWPLAQRPRHLADVAANVTLLYRPLNGSTQYGPGYWMLWVEVLFYAFMAVLIWRGLTRRRAVLFGYTWLLTAALAMTGNPGLIRLVFQPEFASFFVAGIAYALIHRFGPDITLWGLVGVSWVLAVHFTLERLTLLAPNALQRTLSEEAVALAVTTWFGLLAVVALGWTDRLRQHWLTAAAAVVYPFSLLHAYLGWTLFHAFRDLRPRWVVLAGVVTALLVLSWLVHRLVERPVARYLRHQLPGAQPPRPPAPQPGHPAQPSQPAEPVSGRGGA